MPEIYCKVIGHNVNIENGICVKNCGKPGFVYGVKVEHSEIKKCIGHKRNKTSSEVKARLSQLSSIAAFTKCDYETGIFEDE